MQVTRWSIGMRDREDVPLNDWEPRAAASGGEKEGDADVGSGGHVAEACRGLWCVSQPPNSYVKAPPAVLK